MKKTFFTALLAVSFASLTWISCSQDESYVEEPGLQEPISKRSHYVSLEDARANLLEILRDVNSSTDSRGGFVETKVVSDAFTVNLSEVESRATDRTLIHVFNFADNQGFAIMSADDRLPDLIALVESGTYSDIDGSDDSGDPDHPGRHLIDDIELFLKKNPGDEADDRRWAHYDTTQWQKVIYHPEMHCPVKWGQGDGNNDDYAYNLYCPIGEHGLRCKTGCGATAVGQFMAIYKYPASYRGYNFHWQNMTEYPRINQCVNDGYFDIAWLLRHLGDKNNLDMTYGEKSSYSSTINVIRTFENFGYSSPGVLEDYETEEVIYELKNGYPILIRGTGYENGIETEGHIWLGHGLMQRYRTITYTDINGRTSDYKTERNWYILCNWGWQGSGDGYYIAGIFDLRNGATYDDDGVSPGKSKKPINYKSELKIITNIRK